MNSCKNSHQIPELEQRGNSFILILMLILSWIFTIILTQF